MTEITDDMNVSVDDFISNMMMELNSTASMLTGKHPQSLSPKTQQEQNTSLDLEMIDDSTPNLQHPSQQPEHLDNTDSIFLFDDNTAVHTPPPTNIKQKNTIHEILDNVENQLFSNTNNPQLRLDILLTDNKQLFMQHNSNNNCIEDRDQYTDTYHSINIEDNRSDNHFFPPTDYNNKLLHRLYHRYPQKYKHTSSNTDFVTCNPQKAQQMWTKTFRKYHKPSSISSTINNNRYRKSSSASSNSDMSKNAIWQRLFDEAQHRQTKKQRLREKYLVHEIEKEQKDIQQFHNNIMQNNLSSSKNKSSDIFNKLYSDHFKRQIKKKLNEKLQLLEYKKASCQRYSNENRNIHFIESLNVQQRLIKWKEFNDEKIGKLKEQLQNNECSFQPQINCTKKYNKETFLKLYAKKKYEKNVNTDKKQSQMSDFNSNFSPNIAVSQKTVPAPSNVKRLFKYHQFL